MKEKVVLIAAVVIGLLAFWLTNHYLRTERAKLYAGAAKVKVLVAGTPIPAGTVLEFGDLAQKSVFKTAVGENVFRPEDLDRVLGKKLRYSLKKEEPLWWSYVEMPQRTRGGLAPIIKSGLRAISIAVGGESGVSGMVQPNDRVDILGTFTFPSRAVPGETETVTLTVLQDVTVLATGRSLARDEPFAGPTRSNRAGGYSAVTLEVSLREAELLVFAQHVRGNLTLALRNPQDVSFEEDLPEINFEHLENKLPELNLQRQRFIRHKTEL